MTRRIKSSALGLIGVSLFPLSSKAAQDGSDTGRLVYPLNRKWLFSEKNVAGGTALRFDDTRFTRVTIPQHIDLNSTEGGPTEGRPYSTLRSAQ